MGPAETTGIVIVTVAIIHGIFKFAEHLIAKYGNKDGENLELGVTNKDLLELINSMNAGLTSRQSEQLKALYDLHNVRDSDGMPLWYVPRSWADTQREIVSELRWLKETQHKTLDIIERLENRLDS